MQNSFRLLIKHLCKLIPVSVQLEEQLHKIAHPIEVKKGELLLEEGNACKHLYFTCNGLLRGYYLLDGKEVTNWFSLEEEFATCFYSFIAQQASFETIEALEDTTVLRLSYQDLQLLYLHFPETERIGRIITEQYYIKLEERVLSLQFKTARERYLKLFSLKPALLQRASLGHIASYLGITQETLSRIRAEI